MRQTEERRQEEEVEVSGGGKVPGCPDGVTKHSESCLQSSAGIKGFFLMWKKRKSHPHERLLEYRKTRLTKEHIVHCFGESLYFTEPFFLPCKELTVYQVLLTWEGCGPHRSPPKRTMQFQGYFGAEWGTGSLSRVTLKPLYEGRKTYLLRA